MLNALPLRTFNARNAEIVAPAPGVFTYLNITIINGTLFLIGIPQVVFANLLS